MNVPFLPADVESLVVRRGQGNNTNLSWPGVTETVGGRPYTPPYYTVYGSLTPSGPFVEVGTFVTNSFVHSDVLGSQPRYFYHVTAAGTAPENEGRTAKQSVISIGGMVE